MDKNKQQQPGDGSISASPINARDVSPGGFKQPESVKPVRSSKKLTRENLNLFTSNTQTPGRHHYGKFGGGFLLSNGSAAASRAQSGLGSPSVTSLSGAASVTTQEFRAILEERQYQLKSAIAKLKQEEPSSREFDNLIRQVRSINTLEDNKSLKIWVKAIIQAPLIQLLTPPSIADQGFELIKVLLEGLWRECIISHTRLLNFKKQKQAQQQNQPEMSNPEENFVIGGDSSLVLKRQISEALIGSTADFQRQCQSFSKFVNLTFEVFPLRLATIAQVIKLIFSNSGIFACIDQGYVVHPVSITDILIERAKEFLPPHTQALALKSTVFNNLAKLEDVNKKAKMLLEKHRGLLNNVKHRGSSNSIDLGEEHGDSGSKHSHYTNQSKDTRYIEVQEQTDKIFLLTLFTFHMDDVITAKTIYENQKNLRVYVGNSAIKNSDFYVTFQPEGHQQQVRKQISIKRPIIGLIDHYKNQIEEMANCIYEKTIIRKLPTYLKRIAQVYPAYKNEIIDQLTKSFPHKDRPSIVNLLVYQRFALKLASMLGASLHPQAEEDIHKLIVTTITSLDADIKVRMRKGTHLVRTQNSSHKKSEAKVPLNSILQKIESKEQYGQNMMLRHQDEREIKVELMLKQFMVSLDEKIDHMNKAGKIAIHNFSEFLMSVCCEKIMSVYQSNFIQYIPFYIILKAKRRFDQHDFKQKALDKSSSCETLFSTCFISELIQRSFPQSFTKLQKTMSRRAFTLESRMLAWNYLASLLSQKNILDQAILIKSLQLIIEHFERTATSYHSNQKQLQEINQEIKPDTNEQKDKALQYQQDDIAAQQYYSRMFHHCFVQGLLQILTAQHQILLTYEQPDKNRKTILQKLIKIIFKQGLSTGGLQMCSQTILRDFLKEFEENSELTSYIYKDKQQTVQKILQTQSNDLSNSSKLSTFEKIQRFMPYDNYEFLHLKKLRDQLSLARTRAPRSLPGSTMQQILESHGPLNPTRSSGQSTEQVSECDTATNSILSGAKKANTQQCLIRNHTIKKLNK